jgi:hypothetical protein
VGPEHLKFGGGAAASAYHPAVLLLVITAGLFLCFGPRQKAIVGFLVAAILVPADQVLVLGSLHFPMLRILALFGLARIVYAKFVLNSSIFGAGISRVDIAVILLAIFTALNGVLLWREGGAVINQVGGLYATLGIYFSLRYLVRDREDAELMMRVLAYLTLLIAALMSFELLSGHNPVYAYLGGVRGEAFQSVMERDGKLRATGTFSHPILAGTFGAISMPLFCAFWLTGKKNRKVAVLGIIAATVITLTSNSSTPVMAYGAALLGFGLWPLRNRMRFIRWGIVLILVSLHMVMNRPVWSLIARIDLTGSSSGYHRYQLVDQCIHHFSDWCLFGVKDTSQWGWDMWDTANQYVSTADNSGLIPFLLFIAVLVYSFRYLTAARKAAEARKESGLYLWALWVALLTNAVGFFGISYWDQTIVAWYALLAIIAVSIRVSPVAATAPVSNKPRSSKSRLVLSSGTQ